MRVTTHAHVCRTGVLDDIRERLLHDAVQRRLDIGREPLLAEPDLDQHVEPAFLADRLAEPANSGLEAEVVQRRRPQLDGEPAHVLERPHDEAAQLGRSCLGGFRTFGALDGREAEQDRGERLTGFVMELAGKPSPLRLLRLYRPAQRVPPHAARVLDCDRGLRGEHRDDLLVLCGEASSRLFLGQVEIPERDSPRHHRHAEEAVHRRMVGREADRSRIARQVVEAQRPRVGDQHTEDPPAPGKVADRDPGGLVEAMGDEALELAARAVDYPEGRVACVGQLGGDPDERLEDRVERELRGDRDSRLDERAASLIGVHGKIQPVCNMAVTTGRHT